MSMIDAILKETPDTKACRLGPGVTEQVAELFKELFPAAKKALVVDDVNTKRVAGDRVIALLKASGLEVAEYTVNPDGSWFHANGIKVASIPFQGGELEETYFKLHDLGFDGFSTDYPSVMFKVIKDLKAR